MSEDRFVSRTEYDARHDDIAKQIADLAQEGRETNKRVNDLAVTVGKITGQLSVYQKVAVPILTLAIGILTGVLLGHFPIG